MSGLVALNPKGRAWTTSLQISLGNRTRVFRLRVLVTPRICLDMLRNYRRHRAKTWS